MLDRDGFIAQMRVDAQVLEAWIEAGWVVPQHEDETLRFSDIDLSRAQLIRDLQQDLGINDDGVAVVLDLIDQLHGLRGTLRRILACLQAQPEPIRRKIIAELREPRPRELGDA